MTAGPTPNKFAIAIAITAAEAARLGAWRDLGERVWHITDRRR